MIGALAAKPRWFVPEVVQTSSMDCGPATLKCVLEGFRIPVSYGRLREACQTGIDGTSIDTLEEVANRLGVSATQSLLPVDHLFLDRQVVFPAIVVVRLGDGATHFVVVWSRHGDWLQVMDPGLGRRWVKVSALVNDLLRHEVSVAATAWRDWARSDAFLVPLAERFARLGGSDTDFTRLAAIATADPGWYPLAALDATIRMAGNLIDAGGLVAGDEALRVVETLFHQTVASPDDIYTILPPDCWLVAPDPDSASLGERRVLVRGAVLVRVAPRTDAEVADAAADAEPLPPELAAALVERPSRPLSVLFGLLLADGLLSPLALLGAIGLAGLLMMIEVLGLRALVDLGGLLAPGGQRLAGAGALVILMVMALAIRLGVASEAMRLGRAIELRLRMALLDKLPRLSDRYFQSRPVSDMADRSHSLHLSRAVPGMGVYFVQTSAELCLILTGISVIDVRTGLLGALVVMLLIAVAWVLQPLVSEADLRVRSHAGALHGFSLDALLGAVPIRVHRAQRAVRRRHEGLLVAWARALFGLSRTTLLIEGLQQVLSLVLLSLVLIDHFGRAAGVASSDLLLVYWLLKLPVAGNTLTSLAHQYPAQRNVLLRLLEPLAAPDSGAGADATAETPLRASAPVRIEIAGGCVKAGGNLVLDDIDLVIDAGEHVAIVGPSGAGKSSLLGLLLGWHTLACGRIEVDGLALEREQLSELRRQTAWVDPAVQLWNASLSDNVAFSSEVPAEASMASAMAAADLRSVVQRLPDGLRTSLGEGGGLLSGGEGQRVRLARAMAQQHVRLVLLDEPFRGTDRAQRQRLLASARRHWAASTLLCATHDIADTLGFDRVLVVENGRIIEDGNPAHLARMGSRFAELLSAEETARQSLWQGRHWRNLSVEDGRVRRDH
jgi:ABC-type bacteriocin/lantibiotic exporter with double-glycine peptidase domain